MHLRFHETWHLILAYYNTQNATAEKGFGQLFVCFLCYDKGQLVSIWKETVNNSVAIFFSNWHKQIIFFFEMQYLPKAKLF